VKFKRVIATRRGGPEVLQIREEELVEPGPGEVRVKVLAAGVSFADIFMREGFHPEALLRRFPFTPGWDIVGVVDSLGEGVAGLEIGERVAALPIVGGYSEFAYLAAKELIAVPQDVDAAEAVSLILNYVTAYQMLHRSAGARSGELALVHGAAGGVGSALLQLGGIAGLRLYGTASPGKHAAIAAMGATPMDYRSEDFVQQGRALEPSGFDLVFDGIGGGHLLRSLRVLRSKGRLVAYGLGSTSAGGRQSLARIISTCSGWLAAFSHNLLPGQKRVKLYSIQMLKRRRPDWFREDLGTLLGLLADRQIAPVISERLPLSEAPRAHELLAEGSTVGKLVLCCE
jgi:NADPH2:quinone reductase